MFRQLTPKVLISGKISEADLALAKDQGVTLIINNRPDGEEPGQPEAATMAARADDLGLDYLYLPVRGMPGQDAVEALESALADGETMLIHCKSGMRSAVAWALAESRRGTPRDEILTAAAGAGFDLSTLPF